MAAVTLSGGDKVADVLAAIGRNVGRGARVKVGYLEGATYPDGTPVAQVAFWQEFGTPAARFPTPPRPTFRIMIRKHSKEWGAQLARLLHASGYNARAALGAMGELIEGQLVDSILHAEVADISEVTKMLRKMRSENPGMHTGLLAVFEAIRRVKSGESGASGTAARRLIDSGTMQRAPSYQVIDAS